MTVNGNKFPNDSTLRSGTKEKVLKEFATLQADDFVSGKRRTVIQYRIILIDLTETLVREECGKVTFPKENCTYQGTCDDERIVCDSAGDDVSPEFCRYCQYLSRTFDKKPYDMAELLWSAVSKLFKVMKK